MIGAVVYVRVSDERQVTNLSLPTQIRVCEEYCRQHGWEVVARFQEEGESARTTHRTELQKLLKFCRLQKGRVQFVVVYNLTRFAREKYDPRATLNCINRPHDVFSKLAHGSRLVLGHGGRSAHRPLS